MVTFRVRVGVIRVRVRVRVILRPFRVMCFSVQIGVSVCKERLM